MTAIELQFLANRYHGTAWGRHINEGVGEWPPSPYRLLRAMYDAWKRKCSDLSEDDVRAVFEALAKQPPEFHVPQVVEAHTRSYLNSNTENPSDKALIFDGFVVLPKDARCFLHWDVDLGAMERRNLQALLGSLNYLGRSESWIEARLADAVSGRFVWRPLGNNAKAGNMVRIACPLPASEYKLKQPCWLDALAYSSSSVLKQKISGPPAMRYVPYEAPEDGITTWLPVHAPKRKGYVSAAILELSGKVLPGVRDTVRVAERVRGRLMRYFELKDNGRIPQMVHGKDEDGTPLKDHSHLFILPRGNRLGRIDHVLIYTESADGFVEGLLEAVAKVHTIRWIESIRCVASWVGRAEDREIRPMTSKVKSSTPFVTVRHWRKGRHHFLEDEIRRECKHRYLPKPVAVRRVEMPTLLRFRRNRDTETSRPGYAVEIDFPEPVQTPFSLGYASHFGLGQFEAV